MRATKKIDLCPALICFCFIPPPPPPPPQSKSNSKTRGKHFNHCSGTWFKNLYRREHSLLKHDSLQSLRSLGAWGCSRTGSKRTLGRPRSSVTGLAVRKPYLIDETLFLILIPVSSVPVGKGNYRRGDWQVLEGEGVHVRGFGWSIMHTVRACLCVSVAEWEKLSAS